MQNSFFRLLRVILSYPVRDRPALVCVADAEDRLDVLVRDVRDALPLRLLPAGLFKITHEILKKEKKITLYFTNNYVDPATFFYL